MALYPRVNLGVVWGFASVLWPFATVPKGVKQ